MTSVRIKYAWRKINRELVGDKKKRKYTTNKSFQSKKQFFSEKSFERNQENGGKNWLSWHQTET